MGDSTLDRDVIINIDSVMSCISFFIPISRHPKHSKHSQPDSANLLKNGGTLIVPILNHIQPKPIWAEKYNYFLKSPTVTIQST